MLDSLRRLRARFARPQFHWNQCPAYWEGDPFTGCDPRRHDCQRRADHEGPHVCQCGASLSRASSW